MADAIVVCLAARPQLETQVKRRRLALMQIPKPGRNGFEDRFFFFFWGVSEGHKLHQIVGAEVLRLFFS